jgi:L-fuculose-phosphate aldolase
MSQEQALRTELIRYLNRMDTKGWVANHDGNASCRLAVDRYLVTPTGMAKHDIRAEELLVVDGKGTVIRGKKRIFSEWVLHRAVYETRTEVRAVFHGHSPYATSFGASGKPLPAPFLPEAVVSLGPEIPSAPMSMPGADAVAALSTCLNRGQSCLIEGNGVLSWGVDLEQAFLRMELVEHLATIAQHALPMGGVKPLPNSILEPLIAKHVSAGLAAPSVAKGGTSAHVAAISKQVHSQLAQTPTRVSGEDLAGVVAAVTKQTLLDMKR